MTDLKTQLQAKLPELLRQDACFRHWLEPLIRQTAVTPERFDARFERMLQEFRAVAEKLGIAMFGYARDATGL